MLYEMLSGRRAFHGDSAVETLNAILKEEPAELSQTNAKINPALERIVRRCLEKKPERRFQSAYDLAFAIEAVLTPSNSAIETTALPLGTGKAQTRTGNRNHPHILTIFEIGQADKIHFIATEFIDGETLRQRIGNRSAEKRLPFRGFDQAVFLFRRLTGKQVGSKMPTQTVLESN